MQDQDRKHGRLTDAVTSALNSQHPPMPGPPSLPKLRLTYRTAARLPELGAAPSGERAGPVVPELGSPGASGDRRAEAAAARRRFVFGCGRVDNITGPSNCRLILHLGRD